MLEHARRAAAARGWRVGHGSASAVEAPWPYAAVIEALADVCRHHTSLLDGLSDSYRAEIDRVLAGDGRGWTGQSGHQRLFVACAELVRLAAGTHGLLLTVDDLHDADEATLRLLHYLARATGDQRVAIVASYRSGPLPAALADTRASLLTRHAAVELELRPLDRDGIEALVATRIDEPDADLVEHITALSGGIPFVVDELARRAAHEPDWVRHVDVNTIGGIAPTTREVLQRVAVVGVAFDTDQFVALSGLPEREALRPPRRRRHRRRRRGERGRLPVPPRTRARRVAPRRPTAPAPADPPRRRRPPRSARRLAGADRLPPPRSR